nr:hypothetical protein [Tanacetum cinerariifolium]
YCTSSLLKNPPKPVQPALTPCHYPATTNHHHLAPYTFPHHHTPWQSLAFPFATTNDNKKWRAQIIAQGNDKILKGFDHGDEPLTQEAQETQPMVNTRTDADLSAAVQNALQALLPQIRAEIREEFPAGIEEEQAKNFQWGLRRSTLNHLMCMSYTDVAQVANAARNYEILHERDDDDSKRPDKRQKSGDRHQPTSQQSRNSGNGRDQRNRGQQSNRSANSGNSS